MEDMGSFVRTDDGVCLSNDYLGGDKFVLFLKEATWMTSASCEMPRRSRHAGREIYSSDGKQIQKKFLIRLA